MKALNVWFGLLAVVGIGVLAGCTSSSRSSEVSDKIRSSLDNAGYKDVSVSQDRDKGVVTLGGKVAADADKAQAELIAKSFAGMQVVANQIAVLPTENADDAQRMNASLDKGIESNLDAVLISQKLRDGVDYSVKNHVVTLTGSVDSQQRRQLVEKIATGVPNVHQVVNELQVEKQKATSSR